MKFGEACCELRNPSLGSNIERLPGYAGIDNEKAMANSIKSRRANGFTKRFAKNLAK
jgi:hypothetical protein